uniref:Uncharacterized protein n=1 Tax=Cacopsylla melanoneura TaxID=428564 RepID=A0A8D9EE00_9HEMI
MTLSYNGSRTNVLFQTYLIIKEFTSLAYEKTIRKEMTLKRTSKNPMEKEGKPKQKERTRKTVHFWGKHALMLKTETINRTIGKSFDIRPSTSAPKPVKRVSKKNMGKEGKTVVKE